jgi:hypothetical protein
VRVQDALSREWRSRERITAVHLRRTGGSNGVGEVPRAEACGHVAESQGGPVE